MDTRVTTENEKTLLSMAMLLLSAGKLYIIFCLLLRLLLSSLITSMQGCARLMSRESNLTRLRLK